MLKLFTLNLGKVNKMVDYTTIENVIDILEKKVVNLSITYNGDGTKNYAYSFGYFVSEVTSMLHELNLTDEQMSILLNRVKR